MKPLTLIILTFLFGSILATSFHTSMGMEVTVAKADCPLMPHGQTICPMTALDHLSMLRSIFESTLPSIIYLTLTLGVALVPFLFFSKLKPNPLLHSHTFMQWRQKVKYTFSYRLFQDLFARGILNPKLFS